MKMALVVLMVATVAWLGYAYLAKASAPDLTLTGNDVLLATANLDARFSTAGSFRETYMLFGGAQIDHQDAVSKITLAGLPGDDVRRIAARYPDFYMCKSEGAPLAQRKVVQLDLIPVDGRTMRTLESALDEFNDQIGSGGDRVCVRLNGNALDLESVQVRDAGESVTQHYGRNNFYLVKSAEVVDCRKSN